MKISVHILVIHLFTLIFLVDSQETSSKENVKPKKQDIYCSACKSMGETMFHEMNNVDPNERVQVGSYRVDGHGHQKLKDVPLTETRYHAENVLDNVCSKSARDNSIPSILRNLYEHACDDILEEHHDSLIGLLLKETKITSTARQLTELLCLEKTQYCKADQLEELYKPIPTPQAEEKEQEKIEEEEDKSEL